MQTSPAAEGCSGAIADDGAGRPSLSLVVEWANARWNGVPRAWTLFETLRRQWSDVRDGSVPREMPEASVRFVRDLAPRVEVIVASGEPISADVQAEIRRRLPDPFDVTVVVAEGLEYYPLKNHAARRARGSLILFVDCDVAPDPGWLAQLLGTFADPAVDVVCAQTYVAPNDLVSRAFALGWTYGLRDASRGLHKPSKFYANTLAIRSSVFRRTGFPSIGRRTRGAASMLGAELAGLGIPVWENSAAAVAHPPPSGLRHIVVRALAHGRDVYWKDPGEVRELAGLQRSVGLAARRFAHAVDQTVRHGGRVGLGRWQIPACVAISGTYYGFFALGGLLTHLAPNLMGRRFRL